LTFWDATLEHVIYDDDLIDDDEERLETADFVEIDHVTVASGSWCTMDFDRTGPLDPWLLDTQALLQVLLSQAEDNILRPEISKTGNYTGLLFCETLSVQNAYRGHKFGLLLEAMVIQELAGTRRLPVCLPDFKIVTGDYFAYLEPKRTGGRRSIDDPERIRRICKEFGFRRRRVSHRPGNGGPISTDVYWLPNGDNKVARRNVWRYLGAAEAAGPIKICFDKKTGKAITET
jgi:hypothetical protein